MSIMSSIKGTRRLTFNHWRYKLLHWTWGIDPKTPQESELPNFFYEHYCPLFHFTNLLVLALPFILGWRLFIKASKVAFIPVAFCGVGVANAFIGFGNLLGKIRWERKPKPSKEPKPIKTHPPEYYIERARRKMPRFMIAYDSFLYDFDTLWSEEAFNWKVDKEALRSIWADYYPKVVAARQKIDARKKRRRDRIIYWVNVSRFIIKWVLNAVYLTAAVGIAYGFVVWGIPAIAWCGKGIWSIILYLFSADCWAVLLPILKWLGIGIGGALTIFAAGAAMFGVITSRAADATAMGVGRAAVGTGRAFVYTVSPIGRLFAWLGRGFGAFCAGTADFISVFYAENCPPIEIVSKDGEE